MSKVKIPFAEKDGHMVYVDAVENGIKCECICPKCGAFLIAKNAGKIVSHHFAHKDNQDCKGALETAIHKMAKQIISLSDSILTPIFELGPNNMVDSPLTSLYKMKQCSGKKNYYNRSEEELSVRDFRIDSVIYPNEKPIYIEITVTNPTKYGKILNFNENGDLLFEIDLTSWIEKKKISLAEFKEAVLNNADNRRWLVTNKSTNLKNTDGDQVKRSNESETHNYSIELSKCLNSFPENERSKFELFYSDLKDLKQAKNLKWRKTRFQELYEKSEGQIQQIKKEVSNNKFDTEFLKPNLSNSWILESHPIVWQYNLVKRFSIHKNLFTHVHLDSVEEWLQNYYELIPFIERLNNWSLYKIYENERLSNVMKFAFKKEIGPISKLPSYHTVASKYLNVLVNKKILSRKLNKYSVR